MAVRILWMIYILFFVISVVNCCLCHAPTSNRQQFCDSDAVVLAFVYNFVSQPLDISRYDVEYDALVYSVKRDKDGVIPNDVDVFSVKIRTGRNDGNCGVRIELGKSYLFSTSSLDYSQFPPLMYVDSCGWNTKTSLLSQSDLYGIDNWCPWIPEHRILESFSSFYP
ncbi:uncharacterized protein [Apostichopus japonicus]|uniref:uncharacterized protein n=1 Tax=Stichopus japonicus TaxID=307972 RepID=UPI003AB55398